MRALLRFWIQAAWVLLMSGALAVLLFPYWQQLRRADQTIPRQDAAFIRLSPLEVAALPLATRFDMPLGSENGALTYNARIFRVSGHLGDDLNGIGGGNSDLGDPVYAAADGYVIYSGIPHESWGRMTIIAHRLLPEDDFGPVVQTVYAHLKDQAVVAGERVHRGQIIGSVGTAASAPLAHLHFEIRQGPYINPGQGYAETPLNRVAPEAFIRAHRGAVSDLLNNSPQKDLKR